MSCIEQEEKVIISKSEYDLLRTSVTITKEIPKYMIPETKVDGEIHKMSLVTFDNHEYIIGRDAGPYNGGLFMTHSGSCKECQRILRETIKQEIQQAIIEKKILVNLKDYED
jgi:hypothetical protein